MRLLIQRVSRAEVKVEGNTVGKIGPGLLVLAGFSHADSNMDSMLEPLARKLIQLRIFEDELGKMNLSLLDTSGELLVISQFTLYADTRKGNRPNFMNA